MSEPDAPAPRRGSGRFAAGLFIILLAVILSVVTVGGLFLALGFPTDAAQQLSSTRVLQATLQAQNTQVELQNAALHTQVAVLDRRVSTSRESIDEMTQQIAALGVLRDQIQQADIRSATIVAQAQTSRDAVAQFATVEAGRAALIAELGQKSLRIERFLQRLSDISGDAAPDVVGATALPATATLTPTPTPATTPTAELTPTSR